MRCPVCDYRLWQLTTPRCPECGTPFKPSDFEFATGSVQFCCPDCKQAYYGTGPKGHLEPRAFNCVTCGRPLDMDEMILLPTAGLDEEQTLPETVPWLEGKHSRFRAWWNTVGMALVRPANLMKVLPVDSSVGRAIWFSTICHAIAFIGSFSFMMIMPIIMALTFAGGGTPRGFIGIMLCSPLLGILLIPVALLIWSCLVHVVLLITGSNVKPLRRTIQAVAYSGGANVVTGIPCVGMYVGWIWNLISQVVMLKEGHGISSLRATAAVVLPLLLAMAVPIAILIPAVQSGRAAATSIRTTMQRQMSSSTISGALGDYHRREQGRWPAHAVELVTADLLPASSLLSLESATLLEQVPIGEITLAQLEYLSAEEQAAIVKAASDALPPNVIAHRLGDFVFTYHGIDLENADPNLWIAILAPDPEKQGRASTGGSTGDAFPVLAGQIQRPVARANLPPVTNVTTFSGRAAALANQNALRAQHGLPPLPNVWALRHGQPAVAPPGHTLPAPAERPAEAPNTGEQEP